RAARRGRRAPRSPPRGARRASAAQARRRRAARLRHRGASSPTGAAAGAWKPLSADAEGAGIRGSPPLERVDSGHELGGARHDGQGVAQLHRDESVARVGDHLRAVRLRDPHLAAGEDGERGFVTGHEADLALHRLRDDEARLARPELGLSGHQADLQRHDQPFSFWIFAQLASTSLMPPTLKKACSATWSNSPLTIASNDSIVSLSGTVEPSTPVNFFAM